MDETLTVASAELAVAPALSANETAVCERIRSVCAGEIEIENGAVAVSGAGREESVTVTETV